MRKPLIVAALALTLSVLTPAASSQAAPAHDKVTGTGTTGLVGAPQMHVNAVQTRTGVKGGFTIEYPDGSTVTGRATCLFVAGNVAYVIGLITGSAGPRQIPNDWLPGRYLAIGVADLGEPGTAGPDLLNFSPGFRTEPACGRNEAAIPTLPIMAGNYRVFDAA